MGEILATTLTGWELLAGTSMEVVLGMLFLPLSNADMGLQRACLEELHNAVAMLFGRHQEG